MSRYPDIYNDAEHNAGGNCIKAHIIIYKLEV